jgi:hypothetical protein
MDAVNTALLDRLRSAANREASLSVGLSHEIVAQTQHMTRLYAEERQAEQRLRLWPDDPRRNSMSAEARNTALLAADEQRRQLRQVERVAGRPPINEQSALREHARAAERAGIDVGTAAEVYARASAGVDRQAAQDGWEIAVRARIKGEQQLAELEAERSRHGRRAGQLRGTVEAAERWLQANGMATEAAA